MSTPAEPAREYLLANIEQTLADGDQTVSDTDQTGSDNDQSSADVDQVAANRDQAASDHDLASGVNPGAHEFSRDARRRTARLREQTAQARLDGAIARDASARSRDLVAAARDQSATACDLAMAQSDAADAQGNGDRSLTRTEMAIRATDQRERAAQYRAQAAAHRAQATGDRQAAAEDRQQAAGELQRALADHAALARELALTETDALTGARTRAAGLTDLDHELDRCRRTSSELIVAYVDVIGLKAINDSQGHQAGDRLLSRSVTLIRRHLRPYDLIIRLGGDEFLCAMSNMTLLDAHQRFSAIAAALADAPMDAAIRTGFAKYSPEQTATELIASADSDLIASPHGDHDS
jgi:diguanylate cyclase (GGDEF)-like protein